MPRVQDTSYLEREDPASELLSSKRPMPELFSSYIMGLPNCGASLIDWHGLAVHGIRPDDRIPGSLGVFPTHAARLSDRFRVSNNPEYCLTLLVGNGDSFLCALPKLFSPRGTSLLDNFICGTPLDPGCGRILMGA